MNEFPVNLKVVPEDPIPPAEMKPLYQLKPYIFVFDYFFDIAVIAAAIAFSEYFYFSLPAYLLAVVIIGSRINALSILMHDTAHFRAFRNKKLNYVFGEPVGWLLLVTMEWYRIGHLGHHAKLNTLDDINWVEKFPDQSYHYPKPPKQFALDIVRQISGFGYIVALTKLLSSGDQPKVPLKFNVIRGVVYAALLGWCFYAGILDKLLLYWIVPMATVFYCVLWLRSLSEHYCNLGYDHPYHYIRTTLVSWFEAFILSPHNINYHTEHHIYPHVPYYNLKKLHALLMKQPVFREKAHITKGVVRGLFKELVAKPVGHSFADMMAMQKLVRERERQPA